MIKLLAALLIAAAGLSARAADTNMAAVGISIACKKDLHAACKPAHGVSPLKCLMEHKADVSPECRKALDASKGATLPVGAKPKPGQAMSCMPEIEKNCKGVKSKDLHACMKAHRSEFSEFCRKIVDATAK